MDRSRRCEERQAMQGRFLRPSRGAIEVGLRQSRVARELGSGRLNQSKGVGEAQIAWSGDRVIAKTAFKYEGFGLPMVEIPPGQKQQSDRVGGTPGVRDRLDQRAREVEILLGIVEDEEKTFALADLDAQ